MSDPQERLQPSPSTNPPIPARLATGIGGLDIILQGGFLKGDSYIIIGVPGTGKTIFSHQIAFHHIANGGRVIFLTVMTEAHARMISHLRSLSFFNLDAVNDSFFYISGYNVLEKEGLSGLLALIRNVIRQYKATLFVLDGLATIEDFAASGLDFKSFIKSVDAYSEVNGCTIMMLTHRSGGGFLQAEYTMVDGIVELTYELVNVRPQRIIHIPKFRGSAVLHGLHTFEITSAGVVVHPRLEALLSTTTYSPYKRNRVPFDVPRLNEMLRGGVFEGSSTMLLGPTGAGKTIFGLNFLAAGLNRGEACAHFGFYEPPTELVQKGASIGLSLEEHWQSGLLQIIWQPPLEWDVDALVENLLNIIEQRQVKRVFIDALGGFQQSLINSERLLRFWAALRNALRARAVTLFFSVEMNSVYSGEVEVNIPGISAVTDNMILLRLAEFNSESYHLVSIIKLRDSHYDRTVRQFSVTENGIEIGLPFSATGATMTGLSGGEVLPGPARPDDESI